MNYLKAKTRVVRTLKEVNIFNCHGSAAVRGNGSWILVREVLRFGMKEYDV